MHFYDEKDDLQHYMTIVVYKHESDKNKLGYELELSSIQNVLLLQPNQLKGFLNSYEFILAEHVKELECEKFIEMKLNFFDWFKEDFKVEYKKIVTNNIKTIH